MNVTGIQFVNPPEIALKLRDRELKITPIRVGEVARFAKAVQPVMGMIGTLLDAFNAPGADQARTIGEAITLALATQSEALFEAVAVASRLKVEEVAELHVDEITLVVAAAIEVNADFFAQALPVMEGALRVTSTGERLAS